MTIPDEFRELPGAEKLDGFDPEHNIILMTPEMKILGYEPIVEYIARGRLLDCDCRLLQCVCAKARKHKLECFLRFAMTCAIPFACDTHGLDVCLKCYPCTCEGPDWLNKPSPKYLFG